MGWMSDLYKVGVSVLCFAYNQEKYIRDTLEGFAMQRTSFPVEFLIHDDASTDGTADIIREYASKYPDRFIPFIEKENQYSKGNSVQALMLGAARGKYLSLCEGDDYWTDPLKLQRQYEALEENPQCSVCVHGTTGIDAGSGKVIRNFPMTDFKEGVIKAADVVHRMFVDFCWDFHTTSYFFRTQMLFDAINEQIEFYVKPMYLDHAMMLLSAYRGDFYYIDQVMSCYRMNVTGSITTVIQDSKKKDQLRIERSEKAIKEAKAFDHTTNQIYHEKISEYIEYMKFYIAEAKGDYRYVLSKEQRRFFDKWPKGAKMRIRIARYIPVFDKLYFGFKDFLKKNR